MEKTGGDNVCLNGGELHFMTTAIIVDQQVSEFGANNCLLTTCQMKSVCIFQRERERDSKRERRGEGGRVEGERTPSVLPLASVS